MVQLVNYHHDAITGTHFPDVGKWYDSAFEVGFGEADSLVNEMMVLEAQKQGLTVKGFKNCYDQISRKTEDCRLRCGLAKSGKYLIAVHNPTIHQIDTVTLRTEMKSVGLTMFSQETGDFKNVEKFDLVCESQKISQKPNADDCELKIAAKIEPF